MRLITYSHLHRHTTQKDAINIINLVTYHGTEKIYKIGAVKITNRNKNGIVYYEDRKITYVDIYQALKSIDKAIERRKDDGRGSIDRAYEWKRVLEAVANDIKIYGDKIPDTSDVWRGRGINEHIYGAIISYKGKDVKKIKQRQREFIEKFKHTMKW